MLSEADLLAKRATLRWLAKPHPEWTHQDLADALDMSRSWVSKWLQRLRRANPDDVMALHSRSRARHTPQVSIASQPAIVQRILEIRLAPPENLQRVPGPEAILSYVHRDPALQQAGVLCWLLETSVHKIGALRQYNRSYLPVLACVGYLGYPFHSFIFCRSGGEKDFCIFGLSTQISSK
jgi:hypothetical protein